MATKYVQVEGRWNGAKLEKGFKQTATKVGAASKVMAKKTGTFVSEGMGKSMGAFNEKTEKARQLMTAFGGTMGGLAGQATYYAGTLSYVAGRFKKIELGIMGAIAGATLLGVAFYRMATEDMQRVIDASRKIRGELNALNKSAKAYIEQELFRLAGVGTAEQKIIKLKRKYSSLSAEVAQGEAEITKHLQQGMKVQIGNFFAAKATREEVDKNKKSMRETLEIIEEIEKLMAAKAMVPPELVPITPGKEPRGKGRAGRERDVIAERQKQELQEMVAFVDARQRMYESLTTLEQQYEEGITRIREQNADRRERIAQNEIKLQQQKTDAMMQNIQMMGDLSGLVLGSIEQSTAAQVAQILIEAGVQSAMQTAAGFAALAGSPPLFIPRPGAAALHFIAAGLYAAIGIGKAAGVGGGGGGASVGDRERAQGREGGREQESREPTVMNVYIGGKYVGRAINDALESYQDQRNPGRKRTEVR